MDRQTDDLNHEVKENQFQDKEQIHNNQTTDYTINEQTNPYKERRESQIKQKETHTSFPKLLAAGFLGSILTLGGSYALEHIPSNDSGAVVPAVKTTNTNSHNHQLADMLESVSPSVVGVINKQKSSGFDIFNTNTSKEAEEAGTGSGVVYKTDQQSAYIVTNNHVVEGANEISVRLSTGKNVDAKLIGRDVLTDIAVLKIDHVNGLKALQFADSSKIRTGDTVYAIGNPLGLDFSGSVTEGIVSAKERTMNVKTSQGNSSVKAIQTDAAINPGNSGGALINTSGQLIGINSMKIALTEVEGIGFSIPSNDVRTIIEQLVKNGKVERPFMGLSLLSMEDVPTSYLEELKVKSNEGVLVADTDSVASKVFDKYDVIIKADGNKVMNDSELRSYIYGKKKVGETVKFTILRDGKEQTVNLTLRSTNDK